MHRATLPSGFSPFDLGPSLLGDLERLGWNTPTPVQASAIPVVLDGHDIIASAQTGTGKTGAFAIPIIKRLTGVKGLHALILAPTRELALQIQEVFEQLGAGSNVRSVAVYGGVGIEPQIEALRKHPEILVATPGRLIDLLERRVVSLKPLKMLVLDEADRMLDMGFMPQIRRIFGMCPRQRQTMLFSATVPPDIERLIHDQLKNPVKMNMAPHAAPAERADQQVLVCDNFEKPQVLMRLLADEEGTVLVFTRTRLRCERLGVQLKTAGYRATRLHSDRTQAQRNASMEGFRSGRYRILVATDIAARGIDVANIAHVVNYDLPQSPEDYVHRVGRTARAEASGKATTLITDFEMSDIRGIEKIIQHIIPKFRSDGEAIPEPEPEKPRPEFGRRNKNFTSRDKLRRKMM